MTYVEKTSSPEETTPETKSEPEPEPVFIDEVLLFICVHTFIDTDPKPSLVFLFLQGKMDRTLALLQNADPADPTPDSPALIQLEGMNINAVVNLVASLVTAAANLMYTLVFQLCFRCMRTDEPTDRREAAGN